MNRLEQLATGPMTASSAEYLAQQYADLSVDEFVRSLPAEAYVVDFAAGGSDFGAQVARRLPNAHWVNFDIQYDNPDKVDPLRAAAPTNLAFMTGDILAIPETLRGRYDRAFSYNYLPHVLRVDRELGRKAVRGMLGVLKPTGSLALGPTNAKMNSSARWNTVELAADASTEAIEDALDVMTAPRPAARVYDAMAISGVGIYPAGRFEPGKRGLVLSSDGGETLHRPLSSKGLLLAGKLAVGFLRR